MDVVTERSHLFLASRLKRLAETMQSQVVRVTERAGLPVQPGQYPLLATLDRDGPQTIGALTQAMAQSQPSVTRAVTRLVILGYVLVDRVHRDQRHKTVSLTASGRVAVQRSKLVVWPRIESAVVKLTEGLSGPLLDQIAALEAMLADQPLDTRASAEPSAALSIRDFADELAGDFCDINAAWIATMYRIEATDQDVLDHPRARIIDPGGAILFVEAEGVGVIGTCALQKTGARSYELTKMGVLESARGCKAGAFLLHAVIARALEVGADPLYLLSNHKSAAAIHLYEKAGFVHDAEIMRVYGARYARCDVAMRYVVPGG